MPSNRKRKPPKLLTLGDLMRKTGLPNWRIRNIIERIDIQPEYRVAGTVNLYHYSVVGKIRRDAETSDDESLLRLDGLAQATGLSKGRLRYLLYRSEIKPLLRKRRRPLYSEANAKEILVEHVKQGGVTPETT